MAIIQARLTSTRLPRKILYKIDGKRIIDHVVDNVSKSRVDEIVVASPHPIPGLKDVKNFIGDEKNVLERYYKCACEYEADTIVRITADCPLIDPLVINMALEYKDASGLDYVCFAPVDGMDVEVFTFRMLEKAYKEATEDYDKEHVTPYIRKITKLSVDTMDDLKRVRRWYAL